MSATRRGIPLNSSELRKQAYELLGKHKKTKTCPQCGKRVVWPQRVYCSHECSYDFSAKYFGRRWESIRSETIVRDKHTCKMCGRQHKQDYVTICYCEVDHIVEVGRGGTDEPTNLRTLCPSCHRIKTNSFIRKIRKKPIEPQILFNPDLAQLEPFQEKLP